MITRGDIGDTYGPQLSGAAGWLKKKASAVVHKGASAVKSIPTPVKAAVFLPYAATKATVAAAKSVAKTPVKSAVFLPYTATKATVNAAKGLLSSGGSSGAQAAQDADTAKAATDVMNMTRDIANFVGARSPAAATPPIIAQAGNSSPGYGYGTGPAGGYGGGGDVGLTPQASTADMSVPPAEVPTSLAEKWANLSTLSKVAIVAGIAGAGYFGYKRLRRSGGRRRKS